MRHYYEEILTNYVNGRSGRSYSDFVSAWRMGQDENYNLSRFKVTQGLARVELILGLLKGLYPATLLDIGTGRGAFLWPLLDSFKELNIRCVDILQHRVSDINHVKNGGATNVQADKIDAIDLPYADGSYEAVTVLEVLEHIPNYKKAFAEACRVAQNYVIISVPAKEDKNPEHIHLLTKNKLTREFNVNNIDKIKYHSVNNHIIALGIKKPKDVR